MTGRLLTIRVVALVLACTFGAALVHAADRDRDRDDVALVLGDSVPFGIILVGPNQFQNPDNFVGFPDYVAGGLDVGLVNASCPGETTGHFLLAANPDNGCTPYRTHFPLHVGYPSTQLEFATTYLNAHHDVRLVTIMLGGNDGLLLQAGCASDPDPQACLHAGLALVATNMQTILGDLRATGYHGTIVVANYYSLDYSNAAATGLIAALNEAIAAPAAAFGAVVADVFTAFQTAAHSGDTCSAGLLNPNPANPDLCDLHPTQSGHRLIAQTIVHVARQSRR